VIVRLVDFGGIVMLTISLLKLSFHNYSYTFLCNRCSKYCPMPIHI